MRPCSTQLAARLAGESTTLARLWRVTRTDGVVLRFTDAVRPVTIQVAPDTTPQVYRSDVSFTASAIFTSKTFANQQSVTLTFLLDDAGFAEGELRARLYDGAASEVFVVDYMFPQYGVVTMYTGVFGQVQLSDQKIGTVEVTPTQSSVNGVSVGNEKYSQTCRASLGDSVCRIDLSTLKQAFTVASASGGSFVAAALGQENGHWALGFVKWLTGANAGRQSQVQSSDSGTTSVFLLSPPFFPIQAGDTGEIYPGCDKQRSTCVGKFNNMLNMDAEPDVPTGAEVFTNFNLTGTLTGNL
jgi:uncharacterized phage protein (TIGR02218 family)